MKKLTPIPEIWLNPAPNLDLINSAPIPVDISESDLSWSALNSLVFTIRQAETASFQALSYRDFRVGAAATTFNSTTRNLGLVTGFNVKPSEENTINIHAEQMVIEKVRHHGLGQILALAVWGEPQIDDANAQESPTLHPCALCREMISEAPEITPSTAILSSNPGFTKVELYGPGELENYHSPENTRIICGVDESLITTNICSLKGSVKNLGWNQSPQPFNLSTEAMEDEGYEDAVTRLLLQKWTELNPKAAWTAELKGWFSDGQPLTTTSP
jgi:cytidine deaminase